MSVSKTVKIISFILFEIIIYFGFLYIDIYNSEYYKISSIIKFVGIVGCFCYTLFFVEKQEDQLLINLMRVALFFTVISDVFLLLTGESEKGVFTFCIVQVTYRYYLWRINKQELKQNDQLKQNSQLRYLYLPNVIVWLVIVVTMYFLSMPINMLLVITVFYFVSIVINVIVAVRMAVCLKKRFILIFAIGMVLFLLCDINVGVFNMGDFVDINSHVFTNIYEFSTIGMWLFYLPAQVLLAISLSFKQVK